MSYVLYTYRNQSQRDLEMWKNRNIDTEVKISKTRTITSVFDRYITKSLKLIEAGCGLGGWVKYFSNRGNDIIGIEYDDRIVKQAKIFDPKINVFLGDVARLKYDDNLFDGYISLGVIEHFQEGPEEALLEAKRILKNDGLIFLAVPLLTPLRRIIVHPLRNLYFVIHQMKGMNKYFGEYRYTKKEVLSFLKRNNFELVYVGIDDYEKIDKTHHIGIYADFPFLRKRNGEIWELNCFGKIVLQVLRIFSPWLFCSGIFMIAKNKKE